MDWVGGGGGGPRPPSSGGPARRRLGELEGGIGQIPAVQCVRESVGAELPRWRRAPDRVLSRRRVGAREPVISIRERGNRVVGPGRAQGDVFVRPADDWPSEGRFFGPDQRCVRGGRRRLHAAPGWWGGRPARSECGGGGRPARLGGRAWFEAGPRAGVWPKPTPPRSV